MDELEKLEEAIKKQAAFVEQITYEKLTPKTIGQVKLVLLDSIGCMAAGNRQYETDGLPPGRYSLIGAEKKTKTAAVFINGAAMVKNELDEGNQFAYGHPACHIVPAFLAEIEDKKISGKEAITAFAAAYEVSCRWGCSTKMKTSMHVHGTMQTMGAAAVSCRLNHCSAEETKEAIVLANSLPQTASWSSAFEGDQLRNAYIGVANNIGMNAFRMVRSGIKSSIKTLYNVWNTVLDGEIRVDGLTTGLGQRYYLDTNYFKVHSSCRYTHSFVDSVRKFMGQGLQYEEIQKIEIETYAAAAKLKDTMVNNSFAMKFSIPVSVAVCMVYGDLSMDNVTDEHVADTRVIELASKISVRENPDYTAALPELRKNKITVFTIMGKIYEEETKVTKGDYLEPFTKEELLQKFQMITEGIWSDEKRKKIIDFVLKLEEKENVAEVMAVVGLEH